MTGTLRTSLLVVPLLSCFDRSTAFIAKVVHVVISARFIGFQKRVLLLNCNSIEGLLTGPLSQ